MAKTTGTRRQIRRKQLHRAHSKKASPQQEIRAEAWPYGRWTWRPVGGAGTAGGAATATKDTKTRSSHSRTRGKKKAKGKEPAEGIWIERGRQEVIRLKRTPHAGTRAWATPHYARTLTRINVLPPGSQFRAAQRYRKIGTCSRDCQCSTFPRQPLKWYQRCTTAVHL